MEVQGSHHLKFMVSRDGTRSGVGREVVGMASACIVDVSKACWSLFTHRHFSAARLLRVTTKVHQRWLVFPCPILFLRFPGIQSSDFSG
jgi:hypothetical protein